MSGVKRTEDLHSIKTRSIILQNSDTSFPPQNSVLVAVDSRGHMDPTRDINVNSVTINNDRALIDGNGQIMASSISVDSSGTAITTEGDIIVESGSIYTTGFVQTNSVVLLDSSANNPNTLLYANSGNLFWQNDNLGDIVNISQGIGSMAVDPNYANLRLIQYSTDLTQITDNVNALLTIFSNRQVFLDLSGSNNVPIPPTNNTLNAYNVIFNSPCGMIIRFIDASGAPIPGVGDFTFYGNPNSAGSTQYTIANLCNNLTNLTNLQGSLLNEFIQFRYSISKNPQYQYRVDVNFRTSYNVVFLDITRVGEATRFMNHLLFTNQATSFGPTLPDPPTFYLSTPPVYPADVNQYINNKFGGPFQGLSFTDTLKYPNNNAPLASPSFQILTIVSSLITITIVAPPDTTGLTPPNPNQVGSGNTIQRYGFYVNGYAVWMYNLQTPQTYPFNVTIDRQKIAPTAANTNKVVVTSIDIYNETVTPTFIIYA
jgi:hypothetical protein